MNKNKVKNIEQKKEIHEHLKALARFNKWEQGITDKPDRIASLKAVFELYELIPIKARQRQVNVKGIIKMQKILRCLR